MSWLKITCEERDAIYHAERPEKLRPLSSCTDMGGEFHAEPQMDITWGIASTDTPVLRETRYPSRGSGPDRRPCEHWQFQDEPGLLCDLGMCSEFNCDCRDIENDPDDGGPCDSCGVEHRNRTFGA